jgi:predicted Zn finger-like uncharacterized protein
MALATKCPFCQTTFRVAQDQLKLRGGLVRCGSCREVFNGSDYLLAPEVAQQLVAAPVPQAVIQTPAAASPATVVPAIPAGPAWPPLPNAVSSTTATSTRPIAPGTPATTTAPERITPAPPNFSATFASIAAETSDAPWGDDADKRAETAPVVAVKPVPATPAAAEPGAIKTLTQELSMPIPRTLSAPEQNDSMRPANTIVPEKALPDLATDTDAPVGLLKQAARVENNQVPIAVGDTQGTTDFTAPPGPQKSAEPQEQSLAGETLEALEEASEDEDTPGFVQRAERRERLGHIFGVLMVIGVMLLSISLLLQALYLGRNQIAAWLPSTRPLLSAACARLHCTVGLPANIEQLSLESNELQQVPPNQNIYTLTVLLRNRSASIQTWPYLELTLNDTDEKPITRRVFTPREYLTSVPQVSAGFGSNSEQQVKLNFELSQPVASGYRVYLFYP